MRKRLPGEELWQECRPRNKCKELTAGLDWWFRSRKETRVIEGEIRSEKQAGARSKTLQIMVRRQTFL